MNRPNLRWLVIGVILLAVFLGGCDTSTPTPVPPPPPAFSPTFPPQSLQPTGQPRLFNFIKTIQVTPDDKYLGGAFTRINYVPATNHFVVTFGGPIAQPPAGCVVDSKGFSYKEYTLDMKETGKSGTFSCDPFDAGSVMVDNTYYYAAMAAQGTQHGWHLLKIDVTNWKIMVDQFFPLTGWPQTGDADPMVAFVNGQIDLSSQYNDNPKGEPPPSFLDGAATHHQFFSTDFKFLNQKILSDTPHIVGSSLIYVGGIYYFVTANAFGGDVVVMKYDQNWKYLGVKTLRRQAHWSTGLAFDGRRFYVAYLDTRQRTEPGFLPVHLNVRLAAFDRDWNLIADMAVTRYTIPDNRQPGRPWVTLHDNRLYVSYDVDTIDPTTKEEQGKWQAYVSVYELTQKP